jgi:MOSC domain-containing protein YiiM
LERIEALRVEGHPVFPGSTGENLTIQGLDWAMVQPGLRLRVGEADLELTSFAEPCKTIRKSFVDNGIERISGRIFPGWSRVYALVLKEGLVRTGDPVELLVPGRISRL